MVAIVSGYSLGLDLTSLRTLGADAQAGNAMQGRSGERAYVNLTNGNLVLQAQDDHLAARGQDATALRTYNSRGIFTDDNGDNWSSGFLQQPLELTGTLNTAGSTIKRRTDDGSAAVYTYDTARALYVTTDGVGAHDTLRYAAAEAQFEWTDGSTGARQRYEGSGGYKLLSSSDTSGNTLSYGYDASGRLTSVSSGNGESTFYDYVGVNLAQIRTVTSDGAVSTRVRYGYDASNRLTSVTVDLSPGDNSIADGKIYQTSYTYDGTSKRVASVTQADGTKLTITYVESGGIHKVASVKDGLNRTTTFTYNWNAGAAGYATVTDALGLVTRYDLDAYGQTVKITAPAVAGISPTRQFAYDAQGNLISTTDGEGRTVTYGYDANGNQTLQRDHAGNTVTRTFDARNQLLTETVYAQPDLDGAGAATPGVPQTGRYVYDGSGKNLLRFVVSPAGIVTEYRYNGYGERVSEIQYQAGAYPVSGLATGAALLETDLAPWAATQDQASVRRVDMAYDGRGQLQSRTTYATVDAAGAGVLDGSHSVEQYVYDQAGLLLQTLSPRNGSTTYTYDGLGRVLTSTDALGQVSVTQYDDAAGKTILRLAGGLVTTRTFDAAGRLVSVLQSDAAAALLGETRYFYDAGNRLRMLQDPTGVRSWMLYDEAGRKTAEVDGNGTLTEYGYDRNGLLTFTTTYATAVNTAALVDAGGLPVLSATVAGIRPAASAADSTEWRSYDTAQRLLRTARTIGNGTSVAVTEHRYDGASRLVEVVRYGNVLTTGSGAVAPGAISAPAVSAQDRSLRSFHEVDGRLAGTLDAEGYLTTFRYNAAGQPVEKTAYATATAGALRATGTLAQLLPASSPADVRSITLYNGKGQVIAEVDGEGYMTEFAYDANGNSAQTVRYANKAAGSVGANSQLAAIRPASSAADRSTLRTFDALDRLTQETSPEGVVTQYSYDTAGNLASTVRAVGTADVRTFLARHDLQGRLTAELSAEGAAQLTGGQTQAQIDAVWAQHATTYGYDAAGRRLSSTDALGNRTLYFYNADGALTHSVNALGEVQETRYDVQGRVTDSIRYGTRISTAGLAGGLVTAGLSSAIAAAANSALDSRTTITYTRDGRVASSADALSNLITYSYNAFGDEIGSSQAASGGLTLVQTHSVDKRGLRTGTVTDASGVNAITTAVHDAFGRLIRNVDANGNVREQAYDRLGRVVTSSDPLNATRITSYDAFSRVLTQTDALGATTTYAYDAAARSMTVTTAEGISSTTTSTRHGQVQSVSDGKGQVTSYSYDREGRLLQTTTPLTTSASRYDAAGRVVETTDANGRKVAYTYDAASRVLTRTLDAAGLNLVTDFQYDAKGQQVQVTDPAGVVTTYQYDRKGQVLRQTVDPSGLNLQTVYTYDGRGNTLTVTSPGGTATHYVYDALGRRTQERVDPAGLNITRSWAYDKNGNVVSATDALGQVTRFAYDAADRLVFTLDPLGNLRQNTYDTLGRLTKVAAYATPINTTGLPATPTVATLQPLVVSQASQDVVEHRVYDKDSRLTWTVDGTGAVTRLQYDANGNVNARTAYANRISLAGWTPGTAPAPVADSAHDAKSLTVYDALNRAAYTLDPIGAVVARTYDGNGNVLRLTAYATAVPTNTPATVAAMAAAVATVANSARDSDVRYTYDAANRLAWTVDGTGAVTQRVYDRNGNVVRQVAYATALAAGAAAATVTASAADRATSMAYDAANRMVFQVDALRGVTEQVFDSAGNVVRRIAYANAIASVPALGTSGTVAAIRSAITVNASADRNTRYGYDAAGRMALVVDALGAVQEMQFDAAGHVVSAIAYARMVDPSGLAAVPTVAAMKALVTVDAASDRITRQAYDAAGRSVYEVDALGAVKHTQYDGAGRATRITRYAQAIPAGTGNTAAAIATAVQPLAIADQVDVFSYNAAGQLIASTDALNATESYTYDALGRKLTFTNKKGAVWTYNYDAAGRLLSETSPQAALTTVSASGGVLVAGATVQAAIVTRMTYDALGNLTQRTEGYGRSEQRVTRYEYDAAGRQVKVTFPPVGVYNVGDDVTANGATGVATRVESTRILYTRTFYDALGNAVANRDVAGAISQKAYDSLGNLAFEVDALGFVTGYTRNAFGEVTSLVRYGSSTSLANRTISSASSAVTRAQVQATVTATSFSHAADRILLTTYDRAGRVTQTSEPTAFIYDAGAEAGYKSGDAAKTTRNVYDAFGQAVQVKMLRNAAADTWSVTTRYFDKVGREVASADALGYLTQKTYDNLGNLTEVKEYAAAMAANGWNVSGYAAPMAAADDRTVKYAYDRLNRKVSETRLDVEHSTSSSGTSVRGHLVTTYDYDAVGNQTVATDAMGQATYTYYDQLGRIEAIAAPARNSTASGASLTPLTAFRRDAYGNVVAKIDYANGAATATANSYSVAAADASDRTTYSAYDSFSRSVQTTDANGASEYFSYDAHGHLAKRWQGVTGNDGITRTFFEVHSYDKLGQLVQTRTPSSATALQHGITAGDFVEATADENGVIVTPAKISLGWSGLVNPTAGNVQIVLGFAGGGSSSWEYTASAATSGTTTSWSQQLGAPTSIQVLQMVGGSWVTKWQGTPAQATGSSIVTQTQAQAGVVVTAMEYNAFGEMTRKGTQGGRQEYFDYDTAGRLWRTNSGDGVDRISLFDAQGNVTSEIRSSGSGRDNIDIKGFANAQAAEANPYTRRVDTTYDALGRVVKQEQAARLELQGGVTVQRSYTAATVISTATPLTDENGVVTGWSGSNQVSLSWNSLSALGSGDVKVYIEYRTPVVTSGGGEDENGLPLPVITSGGLARSYASGVFNGDAAAGGVTLTLPPQVDGNLGKVTRIVVYKKDLNGGWQTALDQAPGYGRNYIDVAAPADANTGVTLEMRAAGTAGDTGWWTVGLVDFGSGYRFDASGASLGNYEYRVKVSPPGEAARTIGSGTLALTQPPLNAISAAISYGQVGAGVLAWQTPGTSVDQVLRYRVNGSTGGWSTLVVNPRNNGTYDGVDTAGLAAGSYQFELLWSNSGEGVPNAHATGVFTVTAAQPAYWVPPVNLPHITGLGIGTATVGGTITGYDESGAPIYSGGTSVSALVWNAANATTVRYRVSGGSWASLSIDSSGQAFDESGNPTGVQKSALNGLSPGSYQVEVLAGSPTVRQATGNLTIYAQSPGYYQTVTVQVPQQQPVISHYAPVYETRWATRQVPYSVWVNDPPYIIGYGEGGTPIYAYPGHWETRYYTEWYSYQVQVGQTPVYARDENGNIIYQTVYVTQQQQQWVPGTTPTPTVSVTTPPYTPGYTVAEVPAQYSMSINTAAGTRALSTAEGSVMSQSVSTNGGDRWVRPKVEQKVDRWGNVVEITDPRSAYWKTTYQYNASNQLIRQTRPDAGGGSPVTQIFYDQLGRQVAVKDANGNVNGQQYDAAGNLVRETHADGGVVAHSYNAFGDRVKTVDALGHAITFTHDKLGRMLSTAKGQAGVYQATSDMGSATGVVRQIVDSWTYDQLGRKLTQTNGNNETIRYAYDLRGNVIETRQPLGQVVRAAYDAQGRKTAEVDANGYAATWTFDYFGQLTGHTDLGGARYFYAYDNARQLVAQSSTRGQSITYGWDAAGQMTRITDHALGKVTSYAYDAAGRKIRERVQQGGITYQDNHLAYDAQGNLRDVADARVHITMDYDKVGNRTRVYTTVNYQGTGGETGYSTDRYFKYDQMNRQVVVDAVDAAGNIGTQGHRITYDQNGNRVSDTYWGTRVASTEGAPVIAGFDENGNAVYRSGPMTFSTSTGEVQETYRYDALNRLQSVVRDGVQIDVRQYDGADRVVQSGPGGSLPQAYADLINQGLQPGQMNGKESRINRYDANGRLLHQRTYKSDGTLRSDLTYDPGTTYGISWINPAGYTPDGYDAAGNANGYVLYNHEGTVTINEYATSLQRFEGYREGTTVGTSNRLVPGSSTQHYDVNGYLTAVTDTTQGNNNRTFVNDASGMALYVNQAGHVQRQLVVDGQVLGTYGVGVDPNNPASGLNNNPNFANLVDFDFGYAKITANYPNAAPGAYTIRSGDTLQSIAQAAYGDGSLWYRIAEANGLGSSKDLKVGQTLNIPNRVSSVHNNSETFEPYDPSKITGDTSPNLATPKQDKGCGGFGKLLMVIVAVVVSVFVGPQVFAGMNNFLVAAGSMALGNIAGQVVGLATGTIDKFDWKSVALSAISAGVTSFLPPNIAGLTGPANAIAKAAIANAVTQGIGVATGLQKKFDWRGVAASAAGAGVGYMAGEALGLPANGTKPAGMGTAEFIAKASAKGFAAGLATAAARGGRVAIQQIAVDAFGNAVGSSFVESPNDPSSYGYENEMDRQSDAYTRAREAAELARTSGFFARADRHTRPDTPTSWAQDVAARKAALNPHGLPTHSQAGDSRTFRQAEQDFRRATEQSVQGGAYRAIPGDSISRIIGSSDPQAIGNFMRANGLRTDRIEPGRNYFVPDSWHAYGDQSAIGQAALDAGNSRIAAARAQAEAAAYTLRMSGGPRGGAGVAYGDSPVTPRQAWVDSMDGLSPEFGGYTGQGTVLDPAAGPRFIMDVALGTGKGLVNFLPETAAFAYRMTGYAAAGITSLFNTDVSDRMFAQYGNVNGTVLSYGGNTLQEAAGLGASFFGPQAAAKAAHLTSRGLFALEAGVSDAAGKLRSLGVPDLAIGIRYQPGVLHSNPMPLTFQRLEAGLPGVSSSGGINTKLALQELTDRAVADLSARPELARDLMSAGSYRHLVERTSLADASYGKAVERLVGRYAKEDVTLSGVLQYQSRPFVSTPDFFGYEGYNLRLLDITTLKSVSKHMLRPYGRATEYVTHPGLPKNLTFPG